MFELRKASDRSNRRGPGHRRRQHRRGHRDHPRIEGHRGGQGEPHGDLRRCRRARRRRSWTCGSQLTGLERDAADRRSQGALRELIAPARGDPRQRHGPDGGHRSTSSSAIKTQYGDARRTEIIDNERRNRRRGDDRDEDMVVTVTHGGYVKRNPKRSTSAQKRGGRGVTGAATKEEDFVSQLFVASTHDTILMFTSKGRAYAKRVYELPEAGRARQGQGAGQLARAEGGRARGRDAAGARVLRGRVRGHGDARRAIKKTSLERVRQHPQRRASSRSPSTRTTTWSRCASPTARRTCCSARATVRHPLPRGEGARHGPHRARRARHQAARGRATRWSAWRSSRATRRPR